MRNGANKDNCVNVIRERGRFAWRQLFWICCYGRDKLLEILEDQRKVRGEKPNLRVFILVTLATPHSI